MKSFSIVWKDEHNHKWCVRVPSGATTDFASVPRFLRWLISKVGNHVRGAIFHDALYRIPEIRDGLLRIEADQLLRIVAIADKTPRWKARCMYWGVRMRGKKAWKV